MDSVIINLTIYLYKIILNFIIFEKFCHNILV